MKSLNNLIIIICLMILAPDAVAQGQQAEIDSLVTLLKGAGREWNDYANPLIAIGEPAVPALIEAAEDRNLSQWNRRITVMTLNNIHSSKWVEPALTMLFDRTEDPALRNHATAGLRGFDLSHVKEDLWKVYEEATSEWHKSNVAHLMLTADTAMAYQAFLEIYAGNNAWLRRSALLSMVEIRPHESTYWFLSGLQADDWMTANLAMDSLIASTHFSFRGLLDVYHKPGIPDEIRWRIVYVFGHRGTPDLVPLLIEAFQDESWLVHTEATVALGCLEPDQVVPHIEPFRKDSRRWVQNNARWVIRAAKDH